MYGFERVPFRSRVILVADIMYLAVAVVDRFWAQVFYSTEIKGCLRQFISTLYEVKDKYVAFLLHFSVPKLTAIFNIIVQSTVISSTQYLVISGNSR